MARARRARRGRVSGLLRHRGLRSRVSPTGDDEYCGEDNEWVLGELDADIAELEVDGVS